MRVYANTRVYDPKDYGLKEQPKGVQLHPVQAKEQPMVKSHAYLLYFFPKKGIFSKEFKGATGHEHG